MSPVFVFGVRHSGTTILYRMLAYHPEVTWLSQFSARDGSTPGRRRVPGADRFDAALSRFSHDWQKEQSRLRRLLTPRPEEQGPTWSHLLDDPEFPQRLRTFLEAFSRRRGGRRVLAKWNQFPRFVDQLREAVPAASFVHLIRDGRPVALSLRPKRLQTRQTWSAGGPVDLEAEEFGPDQVLRRAAREWMERVDLVGNFQGDLLEVRYEDLCADVHATLRSILEHARLDPGQFPFGRCPRTLANRNARWTDEASDGELEEISEIQRDALQRHGYSHQWDGQAQDGVARGEAVRR